MSIYIPTKIHIYLNRTNSLPLSNMSHQPRHRKLVFVYGKVFSMISMYLLGLLLESGSMSCRLDRNLDDCESSNCRFPTFHMLKVSKVFRISEESVMVH
ncbi:hypothetical protein AYI68_g3580 [Smittium mucronatum]|uniref:Uncharacterized protein n=1 Tax=Smittium mucronatum TaxID=133383 RepID=A0A1R0GZF6_9FUNG|nr:hypothetical protein AYI68_g3580 [Smittium mucronatum]